MNEDSFTCLPEPQAMPSQALLRRMDRPGPRYTSYPTADRFDESFDAAALRHVLAQRRQRDEQGRLGQIADDGLVVLHDDAVEVTPSGWYGVRAVALVFDRYLRDDGARERFSRIV